MAPKELVVRHRRAPEAGVKVADAVVKVTSGPWAAAYGSLAQGAALADDQIPTTA